MRLGLRGQGQIGKQLATGNPFLPERVENERRSLGRGFARMASVWHEGSDLEEANPNVERLSELVEGLAPKLRERLARGARAEAEELRDYEGILDWINEYKPNPDGKLYIRENKLVLPGE